MTIAAFALADAPIADAMKTAASKKAPVKRQATAFADRSLAPEPR